MYDVMVGLGKDNLPSASVHLSYTTIPNTTKFICTGERALMGVYVEIICI